MMTITLSNLAAGYTDRGAEESDLEAVVDLMNAYTQYYVGENEASLDVIRNEWETPGFDLEFDTRLVFDPGNNLVGYVEVWTLTNPPVHPWVWWCVLPQQRGNGIGAHLLAWAEARVSTAIPRCPKGTRVAYRAGVYSVMAPAKEVMETQGLSLLRHSFTMRIKMSSPPPAPVWPEGIRLQVYDPQHIRSADIYRADREAFRDHFGYVEQPFDEGLEIFMHTLTGDDAHDPSLWFLAMDGKQIAGICLCRKEAYEDPECGHVDSLGVLREYRQRGIGKAFLQHAFGEYYRRGYRKVSLGVDAQNLTGALRLYEKAGMHMHQQIDLYEKELRPGQEISVQSL